MLAAELRNWEVKYAGGEACPGRRCEDVIVLARTKDDLSWIRPLAAHHSFVIHGEPLELPFLKRRPAAVNTYVPGREEAKYLAYIIMEYDRLPERMVFLHAHDSKSSRHEQFVKVPKAAVVEHVLSLIRQKGSAGGTFMQYPGECRTVFSIEYGMQSLWKQLNLTSRVGDLPKAWDSVCCAQFAVSREAIVQRPRRLYEDLYDWILQRQFRAKKDKRLSDSTMALEHGWRLLWENVTARRSSPCEDLPAPFASKRVPYPHKPGLKKLASRLRFRTNGVAFSE